MEKVTDSEKADPSMKPFIHNERGYLQAVGGLIALLVLIAIGVTVFWDITEDFEGTSAEANDSMNQTEDVAVIVFDLLPYAALIVVASIIIMVVIAMGGKKQGF